MKANRSTLARIGVALGCAAAASLFSARAAHAQSYGRAYTFAPHLELGGDFRTILGDQTGSPVFGGSGLLGVQFSAPRQPGYVAVELVGDYTKYKTMSDFDAMLGLRAGGVFANVFDPYAYARAGWSFHWGDTKKWYNWLTGEIGGGVDLHIGRQFGIGPFVGLNLCHMICFVGGVATHAAF